jgi:hypothetical protein
MPDDPPDRQGAPDPTFVYDVFISYSSKDHVWVRGPLLERLEAAGLRVCIDVRDFQPGAPIVTEMERAVLTSRYTLVVLTPDFVNSSWTEFEQVLTFTLAHGFKQRRVIPLLKAACAPQLRIQALTPVDFTNPRTHEFAFVHLLGAIDPALADVQVQQIPIDTIPEAEFLPPGSRMPLSSNPLVGGCWGFISRFSASRMLTPEQQQNNRKRVLEKVRTSWIRGVLEVEELRLGTTSIELGIEDKSDAVERIQDRVAHRLDRSPRRLRSGMTITEVFDSLGGELLILGTAGAGKTTLLLQLTQELLARAEKNNDQPLPIVLNLASWAEQRQSITTWLIDELGAKYHVPREVGKAWIDTAQVLPLLDGLDEVKPEHRTACVEAINFFLRAQRYGIPKIVVCSRSTAYDALAQKIKLRLQGAIVVQPLTPQQIDAYLTGEGVDLAAVRASLRVDASLRELAQTPLMLNIMAHAYRGMTLEELGVLQSLEQRRKHLFDRYVKRMFEKKDLVHRYPIADTKCWLTWLAQVMMQHTQAEFLIERMQPTWLQTSGQRQRYMMGVALAWGLLWTPCWLLLAVPGLFTILAWGMVFGWAVGWRRWLARILAVGMSLVIGIGLFLESSSMGLGLGLVVFGFGLVAVCGFGLETWLEMWLDLKQNSSRNTERQIRIVERVTWSRVRAQQGCGWVMTRVIGVPFLILLFVGGCWSLISSASLSDAESAKIVGESLGRAMAFAIVGGLVVGIPAAILSGLSANEVEERTVPNQGIRRSARSAIRMALASGVSITLVIGLLGALGGLLSGATFWDIVQGLDGVILLGLVLGLPIVLSFGLAYGGFACIQHVVLRLVLWQSRSMPLNCVRFFDYCSERTFLRKVGGGYIFRHALLMEYFAALGHDGGEITKNV